MYEYLVNTFFLGNNLLNYLTAAIIFILGLLVVRIFQAIILKRLHALAEKTKTSVDDFILQLIQRIAMPLAYFGIVVLSVNSLVLLPMLKRIVNISAMSIFLFFVARFIVDVMTYSLGAYFRKSGASDATRRSFEGVLRVVKVLVWGLILISFLDNLGFKVSGVIAGLGIGGVAVALAAQAVLGDLFSYFSILFDRPFEVGDFIIVGDYMGVIQHVGIKTTRISSLGGEQIIFSNSDLTNSRVRNYKRMEKRRIVFKLGVVYDTPLDKLKELPVVIERVIKEVADTTFDRSHFLAYDDFALTFETVYYVMSGDYNKYMDIQQEINFAINEEFKKLSVEFAYPTQTVYVNKE